jgi:hypothetical protein
MVSDLASNAQEKPDFRTSWLVRLVVKARLKTAVLPLFRLKDDRPGPAMMVYLACS